MISHNDMKLSGSPPPPRGIRVGLISVNFLVRFTPASAGNTFSFFFSSFTFRVHPRLRGEYYYRLQRVKKPAGSPPPPRGIRKKARLPRYVIRFTPASAGNTEIDKIKQWQEQVHPRLRGEYFPNFSFSS